MVDTLDLKSNGHYGRAGSSPAPGTFKPSNLLTVRRFLFLKERMKERIEFLHKKHLLHFHSICKLYTKSFKLSHRLKHHFDKIECL